MSKIIVGKMSRLVFKNLISNFKLCPTIPLFSSKFFKAGFIFSLSILNKSKTKISLFIVPSWISLILSEKKSIFLKSLTTISVSKNKNGSLSSFFIYSKAS